MPHYYLHQRNEVYVPDEEGDDFADLAEGREKALVGARSILSEEVKQGSLDLRGVIEIAEGETIVLVVPFAEAIVVRTGEPVGPR
jgi:hypothetical protein